MPKKLNKQQQIQAVLIAAQEWCDDEDRSTEFMISYMTDMLVEAVDVSADEAHDLVMDYLGT